MNSTNWIISTGFGEKNKKSLKPPPRDLASLRLSALSNLISGTRTVQLHLLGRHLSRWPTINPHQQVSFQHGPSNTGDVANANYRPFNKIWQTSTPVTPMDFEVLNFETDPNPAASCNNNVCAAHKWVVQSVEGIKLSGSLIQNVNCFAPAQHWVSSPIVRINGSPKSH